MTTRERLANTADINFGTLDRLIGGKMGRFDSACPLCGPDRRTAVNRRRKTLRIWHEDSGFATYHCARCGASGFAHAEGISSSKINSQKRAEQQARQKRDEARRRQNALEIWSEGQPIAGTLAEQYLVKRCIDVTALPNDNEVLRWHPRCPWEDGRHPCMVALYTDAVTNEPRAIHRIAIDANANKIKRMAYGPIASCVIRLWPDECVEQGLVIGEGIETTLAAATRIEHRGTLLQPAWAAGCSGNLEAFPVLPGIEALTILVDHDASGGGENAAAKCASRWCDAGREVIRLTPTSPGDFNNIVRGSL